MPDVPIRQLPSRSFEDRFWSKVNKLPGDDSCWLWTAHHLRGYGEIRFRGKRVKATHAAWFLETGTWPTQDVLHTCDNPPCVRFKHLFQGTQADNNADMKAKGRACGGPPHGERNPNAKLTDEQVVEIRTKHRSGARSGKLALEFSVDRTQIWRIVTGRTRTDV